MSEFRSRALPTCIRLKFNKTHLRCNQKKKGFTETSIICLMFKVNCVDEHDNIYVDVNVCFFFSDHRSEPA